MKLMAPQHSNLQNKGETMKRYAIGTGLCILAGLIVIIVAVLKLPTDYVLIAIPVALVGFAIQLSELFRIRPR